MKLVAVFFGLACVVLAPGALGKTATVKNDVPAKKAVAVKKPAALKKKVAVKKAQPAPVQSKATGAQAKKLPPAPVSVPTALVTANDERQLISMPPSARLALRAEMRDQMAALHLVLQKMSDGQVVEAGKIAQARLGVALWGNHSKLPPAARPEQYMPPKMLTLELDGYKAANDFATVALTGDRYTAVAMLPQLTGSCTQCHEAYRIR